MANRFASWDDPVEALGMEGVEVGTVRCPHVLQGDVTAHRRSIKRRDRPCNELARLIKYPDPFGLRSRCCEGHVVVMSNLSCPGLVFDYKGPTD